MHALRGFGPHGLIVAQHAIDRRHTDAGPPRDHHACRRHGSPPVSATVSALALTVVPCKMVAVPCCDAFVKSKVVFPAKNASFFRGIKPSFDCIGCALETLYRL